MRYVAYVYLDRNRDWECIVTTNPTIFEGDPDWYFIGGVPCLGEAAPPPEGSSVCAQKAPARLGFPGALPQRRVKRVCFGVTNFARFRNRILHCAT